MQKRATDTIRLRSEYIQLAKDLSAQLVDQGVVF